MISRSLMTDFESQHGCTQCPELIECDLGTKDGQRAFVEGNRVQRCRRYVEDAARMAEELLVQAP